MLNKLSRRVIVRLFLGGALSIALLLSACTPQQPILVFVTPTPQEGTTPTNGSVSVAPSAIPPTLTSTLAASSTAIPITNTAAPGATTALPTLPPVPTVVTPVTAAPTLTPVTMQPGGGSVIGPNYTPPPTFTIGPPPTLPPINPNATLPPVVTPGPSPTPGPVLQKALMGIQIHSFLTDDQWQQMLNYAKDLGVGWVKIQVSWKEMEPSKGNLSINQYQALVLKTQRAHGQGFKTLLSIAKAPGWSHPGSISDTEDGPSDDPQDFANFVAKMVRDFKPEAIDAIEIWNEANLQREWYGKPISGVEYMKYFKAAYDVIQVEQKAQPAFNDPNHRIMVITAGPAPTGTSSSSLSDRDWIQQLYAGGLAAYGDDVAVGAHPYGWANPPDATCCKAQPGITGWFENRVFYFRDTLDDYHKIMLNSGDKNGKLWVTEFGWATYDGLKRSNGAAASIGQASGWENLINQQQQADYVLRAFYLAQQPPYYDFLGPMFLWNLNYGIIPQLIDDGREEAGFSLLDASWAPRPVYLKLKNAPKQ